MCHSADGIEDDYAREAERVRVPVTPTSWQPSVNAADADEHLEPLPSGFSHRTPSNNGRGFRSPRYPQRTSAAYDTREGRYYHPVPSERTGYPEQARQRTVTVPTTCK
ncbi:hypothetical protein HPB50_028285 [Hyalomma asiaticum]|nr:hypothetical protein HPB50_028285 [Hyalomma asiaticum]